VPGVLYSEYANIMKLGVPGVLYSEYANIMTSAHAILPCLNGQHVIVILLPAGTLWPLHQSPYDATWP
jgi:hypothetical protein